MANSVDPDQTAVRPDLSVHWVKMVGNACLIWVGHVSTYLYQVYHIGGLGKDCRPRPDTF